MHGQKRDFDNAIQDCTKAIELDPKHTDAYFIRGNAQREKNELENAIKDYRKVIELNPMHADAYFNRAISYTKTEINKAIEDLTQAIKLKPNDAAAYYSFRGMAWLQIGELEKAKSDLNAAKNMGVDIIALLQNNHESIADFE